jgi:hypothetical protein
VIYSSFLNKSSRFNSSFKTKNNFRLENKKKNSKIFLFSSVLTIAVLSIVITVFIDTDRNTLAHASSSPSLTDSSLTKTQMTPLVLPEIGYRSQVLSESVIYSETDTTIEVNGPAQQQVRISILKSFCLKTLSL